MCSAYIGKNMFQFLLISAHNQIKSYWASRHPELAFWIDTDIPGSNQLSDYPQWSGAAIIAQAELILGNIKMSHFFMPQMAFQIVWERE